ncbi:WD G-beta repeat containing protein [Babesia ovata]|uniref:WD G-beta repeat containing protein n=1 Tax=Babesia ovata TaxID=189622 RepID=A0A2H6K8U3_9APIC|nr:WD G-beta repeat containing protein [Babesia ovata]GBE59414.1 WD G-beta repeat containing protein [Babesia ovata]
MENPNRIAINFKRSRQGSIESPERAEEAAQTDDPKDETIERTPEDNFETYVYEFERMLSWAISSLNRSRDELLDVCFAAYLEIYVKLFRTSAERGRNFLKMFAFVFEAKFGHFIEQLLEFVFPDQLASSPLVRQRVFLEKKHYLILSKRARRVIIGWLNNHEGSLLDEVIKESVEFLDGETFNHSQGHLFRRHFIAKHGIDPTTAHKFKRPFHGLYIRDLDNEFRLHQSKSTELLVKPELPYLPLGLPGELLAEEVQLEYGRKIMDTITGERAIMEDPNKLVPLPKQGTDYHLSLRGLLHCQRECRVPEGRSMLLSYTFQNVLRSTSCTISSFDGRFAALGLDDGGILLWDLVTSECSNAVKDVAPVLGESIAARCVSKCAGNSIVARMMHSKSAPADGAQQKDGAGSGEGILYGHDGSVQSLKFGESGQVLLSGGVDGELRLWVLGSRSTRCVYRGGDTPVMEIDYAPYGYYFASCEADGAARLWATDRSFPLRLLRTAQADCLGLKFHPNSSVLVTSCSDGNIRFWDLRSSGCEMVMEAAPSGFTYNHAYGNTIAFAKNGRLFASANGPHVSVFDLYQKKRMQLLLGHKDPVLSMDFNHGTSELAVSDGSVISLWNLKGKSQFCTPHSVSGTREWPTEIVDTGRRDPFTKSMERLSQFNDTGAIRLTSAFRSTDSQIRELAYTPENVLLTLGISSLRDVDM